MVEDPFPLRMTGDHALRIIRELAADTSRVVILKHAKQRQRQRRITDQQIYSCLRLGVLSEGPAQDVHGYQRCAVRRLAAGDELVAVVSFNARDRLLVVTVY